MSATVKPAALKPHQIEMATQAWEVFSKRGIVYLAGQERTGKSAVGLVLANAAYPNGRCLVITGKKPIGDDYRYNINDEGKIVRAPKNGKYHMLTGWRKTLRIFEGQYTIKVDIINYESLHTLKDYMKYDVIIYDEAHKNITRYPQPSQTWLQCRTMFYMKPAIFMSATPHPYSHAQLFHQLGVCMYSPWARYADFLSWFEDYGILTYKMIGGGQQIPCYDETRDDILMPEFNAIRVVRSREGLGFIEPVDELHYFKLPQHLHKMCKQLNELGYVEIDGVLVGAANAADVRNKLLQIEGGTLTYTAYAEVISKTTDRPVKLHNAREAVQHGYTVQEFEEKWLPQTYDLNLEYYDKAKWIYDTFGDTEDVAIMYNFQNEGKLLRMIFKNAKILQIKANAFGVDLWDTEHLVIYSMSWQSDVAVQARARQCSFERETPIKVHYLLTESGVGADMYDTLLKRGEDYTNAVYQKHRRNLYG